MLPFMSPGSPQCICIFGGISLKHPEKSKRYSPDKGEIWVLCSLVFQQVSRRGLENIDLGTVAEKTLVVGICRQCDLIVTCDPRCLYRIWHLPALLPFLRLVHPDSSALGIGDVVLQRCLTREHFCISSQPCPKSACEWLPYFLICVYCCRATASFWPWLTPQSSLWACTPHKSNASLGLSVDWACST